MRRLLFALIAVVALPLSAATRYTLSLDIAGRYPSQFAATVLAEGKGRRVDVAAGTTLPVAFNALVSDDGGATYAALDLDNNTWFPWGSQVILRRTKIFTKIAVGKSSLRNVSVTPSEEPAEPIDGFPTRKTVVKVSYVIHSGVRGAPVDETMGMTIQLWTTDALDASLAVRPLDLTTGEPAVDALLVPALAKVTGFPLKTSLSATRAFSYARPDTLLMTATVSDVGTVDAPPHAFDRPTGQ